MKVDQAFADEALHAAGGSAHDAKKIIEKAGLFSAIVAAVAPDITPYDFQADFVDDYASRMTLWRKPRGVGGSWTFAMRDVGKRLALPKSGGLHMSLNMEDATEKIAYALQIYDALRDEIAVPEITVKNKTELAFENGSTIQAIFDPRGKHKKDLYWDEMAHHPQARKIIRSAMPATIRGGVQFAAGSTVTTRGALFSQMWHGQGGKYSRFKRRTTYWWDCPAHCCDVTRARVEAPDMETTARVAKFGSEPLKELFDTMLLEDFQCEFELVELGEDDAWLPWDLILATTPAGEAAVLNLNPSEFTRFMEDHNDARCFAGYDVGRVRDNGEFSALMVLPNAELGVERLAKTFPARTFEEQEDYLRWFKRHPRTFLAIDKGGMGMNTAEKLVTEFGANQVKAVDFGSNIPAPFQYQREDAQAKTVLAVTLKQVMLSDLVRWQVDVGKNYQMHSVRRAVTEAMRVVYKVDTEGDVKHHADVFWARALAAWMWRFTDSHQLRFAAVA